MLNQDPPVFVPGKYDSHGKWMDGWESRRKRGPGHDWCIVRLARPGRLAGVELDTRHFTGNFPPAASIDAGHLPEGAAVDSIQWRALLPAVALGGNQRHYFPLDPGSEVSHVRVNLLPDGGLARLRVYGTPAFRAESSAGEPVDLIAALHGGVVVAANNEHFGPASKLLLPGRGIDMGDGWETRRRREPGQDWCIIQLARAGHIEAIEVDTAHFKGNYPDRCSIQAARVSASTRESLITQSMFWPTLLPEQFLQADAVHCFREQICTHEPISHVRFNIIPDGGVSRLRLHGRPLQP
jgi:allantoicase